MLTCNMMLYKICINYRLCIINNSSFLDICICICRINEELLIENNNFQNTIVNLCAENIKLETIITFFTESANHLILKSFQNKQ